MKNEYEDVLITGGLGFIGRHLLLKISPLCRSITVVDKSSFHEMVEKHPALKNINNIQVVEGDCTDPKTFAGLSKHFSHIFQLSAVLGISNVAENPLKTLDVNIDLTRVCLDFAKTQNNLKQFIFLSSSEVYGIEASSNREEDPFVIGNDSLRWSYATSKAVGESYCQAYSHKHSLPIVVIRPYNVYGPYRFGSNAMTKLLCDTLLDKPIQLTGDGQQMRSWCYIDDFVSGLILASQKKYDAPYNTFNIGNSEFFFTMEDLAHLIKKVTKSSTEIQIIGDKKPDVRFRRPNTQKAKEHLNYQPKTSLEEGIKNLYQWLQSVDDVEGVLL